MSSGKFDALAAKVGSRNLAGWITTHNPKVAARADATRARHKAEHKAKGSAKGGEGHKVGDTVKAHHPAHGDVTAKITKVHKNGHLIATIRKPSGSTLTGVALRPEQVKGKAPKHSARQLMKAAGR